jgi:hypothetical protein
MSAKTADQRVGRAEGSWLLRTAVAGVLLLAAGAFVLSYSALHAVAVAAGINPGLAGLYPLIIDGFLTIASLAALHLRDHGPRVTWYPWALLGGFFTVSVWCNALHAASRDGHVALTGTTAALVSAMPPIALGLAIHLLILMLRPTRALATSSRSAGGGQVDRAESPTDRQEAPHLAPVNGATRHTSPARIAPTKPKAEPAADNRSAAADDDTDSLRARAAAALTDARRRNTELTGADLGRQLGVSSRHGRRLLHSLNGHHELSHPGETLAPQVRPRAAAHPDNPLTPNTP